MAEPRTDFQNASGASVKGRYFSDSGPGCWWLRLTDIHTQVEPDRESDETLAFFHLGLFRGSLGLVLGF